MLRVDPALRELELALDGVTGVVLSVDRDRLEDAGARLAAAVARLPTVRVGDLDRRDAREQIGAVGAALTRCRRVSAAVADVASVVLAAAGLVAGYDRAGATSGCASQPSRLEARA